VSHSAAYQASHLPDDQPHASPADALYDAPEAVINRALRLFRRTTSPNSPSSGSSRIRLEGQLRFDSFRLPFRADHRAARGDARWLLFEAEDCTVGLRVMARGPMRTVSGQVLGSPARGEVTLRGGAVNVRTSLDELAEFNLGLLPVGRYALVIAFPDTSISIDELVLS
jgi:hypothetical protein